MDASRPQGSRRWPVVLGLLVMVALLGGAGFLYVTFSRTGSLPPIIQLPIGQSGAIPSGSANAGDACVDPILGKMSVAQQAGQVLMMGTSIASPVAAATAVSQYHLGGVFLAGRSSASAAFLTQQIAALQTAATGAGLPRLQIALDQEGGQVQTLRGTDFPTIPSAVQQGKLSSSALRAQATDWARRLKAIGVTLDLAPVADTVPAGTGSLNPPIGAFDREYGSSPASVAAAVSTVVSAVQAAGVQTTLKHFPGLGRVRENTDTSTHAVDGVATTTDPYLQPFASGIQAGTAAVMISSASYPKLDPASVAAFSSPIVTGLLRLKLGFSGLVVSDDLGAAVAVQSVSVGQRAVRFIQAGGDLVLTVQSTDIGAMQSALVAAAQTPAFATRLGQAARDVLRSKFRAGLLTCSAAS